MNVSDKSSRRTVLELPATAPLVRITAGLGSAGQKTWNLRRPVTLIGSRRPAHIVLHDRDISSAHCAIVNTGTDVLLKDLHTSKGTLCNRDNVDLVLLNDGDVISVGNTKIQVAIHAPENENDDSGCGVAFVEPTKMPQPVRLHFEHTDKSWEIEDALILIGRHNNATIRLDHQDVSTRHALLFRFADQPVIFDLGSRTGIGVNGAATTMATLRQGDRVGIGPCTLTVEASDPRAVELQRSGPSQNNHVPQEDPANPARRSETASDVSQTREPADKTTPPTSAAPPVPGEIAGDPLPALSDIGAGLNNLQSNIAESWERLNVWQSRLLEDETELNKRNQDLATRKEELDAKDAALRGHLHDITQYSEQIAAREQELAAQLTHIQEERDQTTKARSELEEREKELARHTDELKRREHVLAQRWARLQSATCPHCRKPLRVGMPGPTGNTS